MNLVLALALIAACGGRAVGTASDREPSGGPSATTTLDAGGDAVVEGAAGQAAIASSLNDEGVQLMYDQNPAGASSKFREAVARMPEAKYFFNLCASLFQEGKFAEALTACAAVEKTNPTQELATKASTMIDRIQAEAKAQNLPVAPDTTPSPAGGGQAAIAAKANDEGVKLVYAQKFAEASMKFRDAAARVPEPKYFFNLCTSLFQEGKFNDALTSCAASKQNNPSAALAEKLDRMIKRIRDEAKAQNVPLEIH
jgi:tetratricopeptide (TPR) repeat protein